jgi:transglutaminase-like putative cysteine protease
LLINGSLFFPLPFVLPACNAMRFGERLRAILSRCICFTFAATFMASSAHASDYAYEKFHQHVEISNDGTFRQTNEIQISLRTAAGAKGAAQIPLAFSESLQTLEILEAYTLRPDGVRVDVKPDAIFTQASPLAVSAPMFSDIMYRIVVFPEPALGGKLVLKTRINQSLPFFPGQYSFFEGFTSTVEHVDTQVTISAPKDYALKFDSRGLLGGELQQEEGRYHWTWRYTNPKPRKPELFEVAETDFGAYLAVSSFADWAQLGKAYLARGEAQSQASDALMKLATSITKSTKDRRQQTRLVHEWVAKNIRYVGVFLGLGGFVPRTTAQIIETKYGDCKDHTALTIALLRALGIDSTPALIQLGNAFELPKVPVIGAFNHVIVYVPEFDLYLDGTSQFDAWNILPDGIAGKPTLLTGTGKVGATPKSKANLNSANSVITLNVAADGTINGQSVTETSGAPEAALRARLAFIPSGQQETWTSSWIKRAGPKATATLKKSMPLDHTTPLIFEMKFVVEDMIPLGSPGAFMLPKWLTEFPVSELVGANAQVDKRTTSFACNSDSRSEEFEISLPKNVKVHALPKPIIFQGKTIRFESSYRQMGNVIFAKRRVVRDRPSAVCGPEMWDETQQLAIAISRDARGQVLLR